MNLRPYLFYIVVGLAVLLYYGGRYLYFKPKFDDGHTAPNFTATLIDGSEFDLKDLRGHYVLLDFWGSWCGPCRQENPDIVRLYEDYRGSRIGTAMGFQVVSIGIELSEQSWRRAINNDKLDWPYHIGQFESFDSPIPKTYGVREIPTKYLIGPSGEIVLVNPTVSAVGEFFEGQRG